MHSGISCSHQPQLLHLKKYAWFVSAQWKFSPWNFANVIIRAIALNKTLTLNSSPSNCIATTDKTLASRSQLLHVQTPAFSSEVAKSGLNKAFTSMCDIKTIPVTVLAHLFVSKHFLLPTQEIRLAENHLRIYTGMVICKVITIIKNSDPQSIVFCELSGSSPQIDHRAHV